MSDSAIFSAADLRRIEAETFVRRVEFHRELPSTNDLALELARWDDVELPLLVLAQSQTAGRGRGENRWWSSDGALTFSIVLPIEATALTKQRWPQISITAALAVCDALAAVAPSTDVGLKWPNDVYIARHKICGILVEVPPRGDARLVVGIGLNVNNSFASAPPELRMRGVSLFDATGRLFALPQVLIELLGCFENRFQMLCRCDPSLNHDWRQRCMLRGRTVHLDVGSRRVVGVCQGIDEDGALSLLTEAGTARHFAGVVHRFE